MGQGDTNLTDNSKIETQDYGLTEVSAVEAARRLKVGLDYVYGLLWTRKLAGQKVGRTWRVPVHAIDERLRTLRR